MTRHPGYRILAAPGRPGHGSSTVCDPPSRPRAAQRGRRGRPRRLSQAGAKAQVERTRRLRRRFWCRPQERVGSLMFGRLEAANRPEGAVSGRLRELPRKVPTFRSREGAGKGTTPTRTSTTRASAHRDGRHPRVVMRVFPKKHSRLGGMFQAIAVLKLCADDWEGADSARRCTTATAPGPFEPVLTIGGDHLVRASETVYLPATSRAHTLITTNVVQVLGRQATKPIHLQVPARHDHHRVQTGRRSTRPTSRGSVGRHRDQRHLRRLRNTSWWGNRGVGTVPRSPIASLRR